METTLTSQLIEVLRYGFMQRALVAGVFVACTCGVLGVFLVLRRFSMFGEGLAHFAFGAIGLALLLGIWPLYAAVPLAVVAAVLILKLSRKAVHGDAAIGMFASTGVAVGIMCASLGGGFNVDLFGYLFGDILAIGRFEAWAAVILSVAALAVTILLYGELFAIAVDADTARVLGVRVNRIETVLMCVAAVTVVLGIKVVGAMLVSSLIVFPAVTALRLARGFRVALVLAAVQAAFSVVAGICAAFLFDWPAGAAIVLTNAAMFGAAEILARLLRL